MTLKPRTLRFENNYAIVLKELVAALIAGSMLSFAVVLLWLVASPSSELLLILIAVVSIGLFVSYVGMQLVLHPPVSLPKYTPSDFGIDHWKEVRFQTEDNIGIAAWYIRPSPALDGATIIFLHGMGSNRSELVQEATMLARKGYGALLLDLRNHGHSDKTMTTFGYREVEDVRGAVNYLLTCPEVNPGRIGLFGFSLGGATALCAAARIPRIKATVAQSAFTSLEENIESGMLSQLGLPPFPFAPFLIWLGEHTSGLRVNQVRPISEVAHIYPRAVLFIHGKQDTNISPDNSRRLYAAAYEPKSLYLVNGADHKSVMLADSDEYIHRVARFFDRYLCMRH